MSEYSNTFIREEPYEDEIIRITVIIDTRFERRRLHQIRAEVVKYGEKYSDNQVEDKDVITVIKAFTINCKKFIDSKLIVDKIRKDLTGDGFSWMD